MEIGTKRARGAEVTSENTSVPHTERLLREPCSGLHAKDTDRLPEDWILNVPHGKWFVICNDELISLQIRDRGEANSFTARRWGFSSVLKSHQLVAMLSSELPARWPHSWTTNRPSTKDDGYLRLICIDMENTMTILSEEHPGVNVAIL